jgi:hypothetical protein
MAPGIGAGGFVGVAIETTAGTYTAPTKYIPIQNESLQYQQETIWRRPIRQTADIVGAVSGNAHVEGDISMEAFEDVVAVMLYAARTTPVKTGTTPNWIYTYTGNANAIPTKTMSITVVRNGVVFAYTGCVVSKFTFTIDDGLLMFNTSILGRDEATQSAPTPTWPVTQVPYGAGTYHLTIPTATQIFDADTFDFEVDDNGTPQYRLKDTGRGAQFINFGERAITLSTERDFDTRTEYDAFKSLTAQSITLAAAKGINNSITLTIPAAIKDTYELGLSGQGDLIRASIAYNAVLDSTGNAYTIVVNTQETIT